MKKSFFLFAVALILMLSSCQSTKVVEKKAQSLDFSRDGGKTLDGYWDSYFHTKDTYYLDQILAYAESEDAILINLTEAYKENKINDSWIEYLDLKNKNGILTNEYDMDFISVYFIRYGEDELANNMKYIYSLFPQDLLIRNSVKSSAYWSLASNAEQREDVMIYLKQKLPNLSSKTRKVFNDIYDIQ